MISKYTTMFILLFFLMSCYENERILSGSEDLKFSNPTPSETFIEYWRHSKEGDLKEVKELTTSKPIAFTACLYLTEKQCQEKLSKYKTSDSRKPNNRLEIEDSDEIDFTVSKRIPSGIGNGTWKFYSIQTEWVKGNQGRVRILVQGAGYELTRDVLLYKINSKWKIFAIVDKSAHKGFASPQHPYV